MSGIGWSDATSLDDLLSLLLLHIVTFFIQVTVHECAFLN